ncbi:MAG: reverse gyrase [Metallosphaera yellowstonensis]|jgi:Reverse gyrase
MITSVFHSTCPNCQGPLEDFRALQGLPCTNCLPGEWSAYANLPIEEKSKVIYNLLVNNGKLARYWELYYTLEAHKEMINYFKEVTGKEPWSLQRLWLRRLSEGDNFSLSAPTGMGKTTTLIVHSAYLSKNVLYLVPTKSLQEQICNRLGEITSVSCGSMNPNAVSVLTASYINRNFQALSDYRPKFIAVDDADSIIKSGKTTDKLVQLMGIPKEVYEDAMRLVRLRRLLVLRENKEELMEKLNDLENKIKSFSGPIAQLVVASASLRPKGIKQKALRHISGFDISTAQTYARNIVDSFTTSSLEDVVERMGPGGLVLVSREYGKTVMRDIKDRLDGMGFKVGLAIAGRKFLKDFSEGKTNILVGSASYYGVAVRGIDEPKALKYVVFYGVPKSRVSARDAIKNPYTLLRVARLLGFEVPEEEILTLSPGEAQAIKISILQNQKLEGRLGEVQQKVMGLIEEVSEALSRIEDNIVGETFLLTRMGREVYLQYPDVITYLQGSGRSSRLLNGGLTKGLSVVIVDDQILFEIFKKKMNYIIQGFHPEHFESLDLKGLREEIERTREEGGRKIEIRTGLMVVESPTKARTISKLFGLPSRRFVGGIPVYETVIMDGNQVFVMDVVASKGHVTDLTLNERGIYGVEVRDRKIVPHYSPLYRCLNCRSSVSKEVEVCPYCGSTLVTSTLTSINALRKLSLEVDEVFLATDPDVEGEKIAFDIAVGLVPYNPRLWRVKYHEVTRTGILEALRNPASLDLKTVESQIVRRIEDRWIGFELSKLLRIKFGERNHGAGRVQTPVLGWIVRRTQEYKSNMGWVTSIRIGNYFLREFSKDKWIPKEDEAMISKIGEREELLDPPPPFSTDELLVEAYRQFRLPAERVMRIAQDLFESGLITYHRTDSHHISSKGIEIAKEYLQSKSLLEDLRPRSWGQEGTHEAIRPTRSFDVEMLKKELGENPSLHIVKFTWAHFALYDLIFRRFIASQMRESVAKFSRYEISLDNKKWDVELLTEMRDGFSKVYSYRVYAVPEGRVKVEVSTYRGSSSRLLTYADVIKQMKERRIGRPSTYAKTLQTLLRHGYVVESKRKAVLIATKKGIEAYNFLSKFPELVSEEVTAELLNRMDMISLGNLEGTEVLLDLLAQVESLEALPEFKQEI